MAAVDPLLTRWRFVTAAVVLGVIGIPLAMPFLGLFGTSAGWYAWNDFARIGSLIKNTLILAAGTLALSLPAGTLAAILLYRTDLPGQKFFRLLTILTLFVPLPLLTSAWQAALGADGWWPVAIWGGITEWKPWPLGIGPAIWVHAVAAFPWVVLIVGQGLARVERGLEEEALLGARASRVLWKVTLVRSRGAIGAAGLWVVVLATTEITVTDVMRVRTFAEEVYTQLVQDDRAALLRSVALAIPPIVLLGTILAWTASRLGQHLPVGADAAEPGLVFRLGHGRWPVFGILVFALGVLGGIPVASLIWKAGLAGSPATWSGATVWGHVVRVLRLRWSMILETLELAVASGVLVAWLSLVVCWLALGSRWFFAGVVALMAVAWTLPAPIAGFGLKETILRLLDLTNSDFLARVLYHGPSQAPVIWAHVVRFFPYGVALLWPLVRLIPSELSEAARVDGARPGALLSRIIWPLSRPAWTRTALAVGVLSLGELGAGKLVETPGPRIFAHEIFEQMHYGVGNELAALCLILLGFVGIGGGILAFWVGNVTSSTS